MTMTANAAVEPYNDRMPVLLEPQDYARWLGCSIRDVIGFQIRPPIAAARMERAREIMMAERAAGGGVERSPETGNESGKTPDRERPKPRDRDR